MSLLLLAPLCLLYYATIQLRTATRLPTLPPQVLSVNDKIHLDSLMTVLQSEDLREGSCFIEFIKGVEENV